MQLKKDKPLMINLIYMIVLGISLVCDVLFSEGIHVFRIGLAAVTAWVFYFVYKKTFLRKSRISFYLIFIFIFASTYMGSVWNFYILIPGYDKILHLISGIIIALIGYIFFLALVKGEVNNAFHPMIAIVFPLLFAIAAAGVWEIWEFSTDQLFGFTSQNNSLIDTMWDIICGTVMGLVGIIPIVMHIKGKKVKFIETIIEEMKK